MVAVYRSGIKSRWCVLFPGGQWRLNFIVFMKSVSRWSLLSWVALPLWVLVMRTVLSVPSPRSTASEVERAAGLGHGLLFYFIKT